MNFIQGICNQLVVPPKLKYSMMDMGYAITGMGRRYDFNVLNKDNQNLKTSLYIPKQQHPSKLCVLYLHSMNGSRLQCLSYVENFMQKGLHLCSFDFSGCGLSDGNSISFGANQKYDISAVIQHLVQKVGITKFMLWGRSMGAVASLKYCQMLNNNYSNAQIHGLILDSPFQSLKKLIVQLGAKRTDLPKFFVHAFYHIIKGTLQSKGNFEIDDLQLINSMKKIQGIPILFLVSKDDITIQSSHSQNLYYAYKYWNKKLVYFNGLHNQSRDQQYVNAINAFTQDKINHASQPKKTKRYKRVVLEQQIIRRNITEKRQKGEHCQCKLFGR